MEREFENLFFKNSILKLYLLDLILSKELKEKIIPDIISDDFKINLNTVKKAIKELTDEGYFETKKKSGTRLKYNVSEVKAKNYYNLKNKFLNIIETGRNLGFSNLEIISAFVSSLKKFNSSPGDKKVIFVEKDFSNLWIGKMELEEILEIDIVPMLLEDALKYIKTANEDTLIVTTYYCQPILEIKNFKVFPLKITPPIEQLININTIPEDASIIIVTLSEDLKSRLKKTYTFLQKKFKNLKFVTIREILEDKSIIQNADILLTLKNIYKEHENLFKNIRKVVVYSRFHDDEGIELLKKYLFKEKDS